MADGHDKITAIPVYLPNIPMMMIFNRGLLYYVKNTMEAGMNEWGSLQDTVENNKLIREN